MCFFWAVNLLVLVQELEPKKWVFDGLTKQYRFFISSVCLLFRKDRELSKSVALGQKLKYFADNNETNF